MLPILLRRFVIIIVAFALFGPTLTLHTAAQDDDLIPPRCPAETTPITQEDLDGDGTPDLTTIQCELLGPGDEVRVYDEDNDMVAGDRWDEVTDFDGDSWVFDVAADGFPELIILFSSEGNTKRAILHFDLEGNRSVEHQVVDGRVTVTEGRLPAHVIEAVVEGDWWLPNGMLNWNVNFLTNGPWVYRGATDKPYDTWAQWLGIDEEPDILYEYKDVNLDGMPEHALWLLLEETPDRFGAMRTGLNVNERFNMPDQPEDYFFWPFLMSTDTEAERAVNYLDKPPHVKINWETAVLSRPMLEGYPIEHGYHVNSLAPSEKGQINYINFEMMQAYYDLALDYDNRPEMHIRHRYYEGGDRYGYNLPIPVNEMRYSWNQWNEDFLTWDYKLGLGGRQTVDSVVSLDGFDFYAIPHEELPDWVVGNSWDVVTLVAAESYNYLSTEGNYEWNAVEIGGVAFGDITPAPGVPEFEFYDSLMSRYLAGGNYQIDMRATFSVNELHPGQRGELQPGQRGEVVYDRNREVEMYVSPIDQRLHLVGAAFCVWRGMDDDLIQCENLNQDDHIDYWSYSVEGELQKELYHAEDLLIYTDAEGVTVRRADVPAETFRSLPPTDNPSWESLGEGIGGPSEFGISDLDLMFAQFDGPTWTLAGATLRDMRYIGGGFRFVLTVAEEATIDGVDIAPGEYVMHYADGEFTYAPFSPAEVAVTEVTLPDPLIANVFQSIPIAITNSGLEDAENVLVRVLAEREGREPDVVDEVLVDVMAESTHEIEVLWSPPSFERTFVVELWTDPVYDEEEELWTNAGETADRFVGETITGQMLEAPSATKFLSLDQDHIFSGLPVFIMLLSLSVGAGALTLLINRQLTQDMDLDR